MKIDSDLLILYEVDVLMDIFGVRFEFMFKSGKSFFFICFMFVMFFFFYSFVLFIFLNFDFYWEIFKV